MSKRSSYWGLTRNFTFLLKSRTDLIHWTRWSMTWTFEKNFRRSSCIRRRVDFFFSNHLCSSEDSEENRCSSRERNSNKWKKIFNKIHASDDGDFVIHVFLNQLFVTLHIILSTGLDCSISCREYESEKAFWDKINCSDIRKSRLQKTSSYKELKSRSTLKSMTKFDPDSWSLGTLSIM